MSDTTTDGIRVEVISAYVPEHSDPAQESWFFVYRVCITNMGEDTVQLLSRHWIITDATGSEEHVRGPGVVGTQPVLRPGQRHEYTSACPLRTSMGTMHGTYTMERETGDRFQAVIAPFVLADPLTVN